MSYETIITAVGLVLDIIGVVILFKKTSVRHIEAEIGVGLLEGSTPKEGEEWVHPYSFEEHQRGLSYAKQRVKRTHNWLRIGLGLILLGFILQAIALFI